MKKCVAPGWAGLVVGWLLLWGAVGSAFGQQAPAWQFALGNAAGASLSTGVATDADGNLFITGYFFGQVSFGNTTLMSSGGSDMYLAKWDAATSTWAWATSGYSSQGLDVAVSGHNVYVTGHFAGNAVIAGTSLSGAGSYDIFVAKYIDNGLSVSNGWAISGGSSGVDMAFGLTVKGTNVYVTGYFAANHGAVVIAGTNLSGAEGSDVFVAKYVDNGSSVSNGWAINGGGTGHDYGSNVAVRDSLVYVTGSFESGASTHIAGTSMAGMGGKDVFVARYIDRGTSVLNGGAISGGGTADDQGSSIAVSGSSVYVTGTLGSGANGNIAGASLPGAGAKDIFLAKYVEAGTGLTNGWATSGGGPADDTGVEVVVSGAHVFVIGDFASPSATIAGVALSGSSNGSMFLAKYLDTGPGVSNGWATTGTNCNGTGVVLSGPNVYATGLAGRGATFGSYSLLGNMTYLAGLTDLSVGLSEETGLTTFTLAPNPAHHTVRLTNAPAATAAVMDALGRTVRTSDLAPLTADLSLHGLPPGLYVVRCGGATRRLVVE